MDKRKSGLYWIFVVTILLLTILRYSGRLFSLSTYRETFIVLLGGFLLVGLLIFLYKYLSNKL